MRLKIERAMKQTHLHTHSPTHTHTHTQNDIENIKKPYGLQFSGIVRVKGREQLLN